jgi:hypothetical protein
MPPEPHVEIVVYDAPAAPRRGSCDCGCDHHDHDHGHDHCHEGGHGHHHPDPFEKISLEMQTRAMALTLEKEFPGKVRVEYINVLKDPRGPGCPKPSCCAPSPIRRPWSI